MRFIRGALKADVWLANHPAVLIIVAVFLGFDFLLTLDGVDGCKYIAAQIYWERGADGRVDLFDRHDPRFTPDDDTFDQVAADILTYKSWLGVMGFYTQAASVHIRPEIDAIDKPRVREAVIAAYLDEGGSPDIAARLHHGDVEPLAIGLWLFLSHLALWLWAVIVVAVATIRLALGAARNSLRARRPG